MEVRFVNVPPNDTLLVTPETHHEAEELKRWDNCVLSAKFDYKTHQGRGAESLLIVKEI